MSKELRWCGTTLADYQELPDGVRRQFSTKLQYLRAGVTASGVKGWSGIGPGGRELKSGGYRLVITIEFDDAIYALHAFKKDSGRGRHTRKRHSDLVERRYRELCSEYAKRSKVQ
jgi:phage-related protein